ncbi:MAG: UbiA family prenyltransferase [Candidatus Micrarchaeia archaeon]
MSAAGKLIDFLETTVPQHYWISIAGFLCGVYLAIKKIPEYEIIWPLLVVGPLIVAAFNSFNAVFDRDIDRINKPYRSIPAGRLSPTIVLVFSAVLYFISIFISFFIVRNNIFAWLVLADTLLTILYSLPPIRLKNAFIISNLVVGLHYGFFPITYGWVLYSDISLLPIPIIAITTLLAFSANILKDFEDYVGDKAYKVRTIPVFYGPEEAARLVLYLLLIPYFVLFLLVFLGHMETQLAFVGLFVLWAYKIGRDLMEEPLERGETARTQAILLGICTVLALALFS